MSSSAEILSGCDLNMKNKETKELKDLTNDLAKNNDLNPDDLKALIESTGESSEDEEMSNKENNESIIIVPTEAKENNSDSTTSKVGLKKQTSKQLSIEDDIRMALESINIDQITTSTHIDSNNNQLSAAILAEKKAKVQLETTTPIIVNPPRQVDNPQTLSDQLEDARWMMKEFLNGKFHKIMEYCKERAHISFFHECGSALFDFLDAFLALDKEKLNGALASMRKAGERANSYRRKTGIVGYLVRGDFTNYTDLELHAELIFAVTELMTGLLTILADQSIYGAVNSCIKAKSAYSCLKNCQYGLEDKLEWESEVSRQNLEAGTCLGIGGFDLILSFCPTVVTRILDYVGFNSDRLDALDKLKKCIDNQETIFFEICAISMTVYHAFLSYFYGIGELNEPFFDLCSQRWNTSQTNIEIINVGRGSRDLVMGKPVNSIEYFQATLSGTSNKSYPQLNYVCYWQLTWSYVMLGDWSEAAHYSGLLKDNCTWSRCMFTYLHAIFLFQHMENNKLTLLEPIIAECLGNVPKLKRHLGGKRAFHEKIVLDRSKRYANKVNDMLLPAFELIYIWNIFKMMSSDLSLLYPMLEMVEEKLKIHKKTLGRASLDKYCYLIFMKAVILKNLKQTDAALELFNEVLSCKSRIVDQTNLLAQSCFEIGLVNYESNDYKQAKKWIKRAKSDYSGYVSQSLIEYRVRWVLDIIKKAKKDERALAKQQQLEKQQLEQKAMADKTAA